MQHEPHWRRIALYIMCVVVALYLVFAILQALGACRVWMSLRAPLAMNGSTVPATVNVGIIDVASQALSTPLSCRSPGYVTWMGQTFEYPAPAAFVSASHSFALETSTGIWHQYRGNWYFSRGAYRTGSSAFGGGLSRTLFHTGHCAFVLAFSTLTFALLPQSRRKARVRWAHVLRIACYASVFLLLPLAILTLWAQLNMLMLQGATLDSGPMFLICFVVLPVGLMIWWGTAIGRYLRMPHAWAIAVAVIIVGTLCSLACGYLSLLAKMTV